MDGDGLADDYEFFNYGTDPQVSDASADTDGDGLTNVEEVDLYDTNPTVADTDKDGITDGKEIETHGN